MKNKVTALFLLIAMSSAAQKEIRPGKWLKLFNGKSLKGWTVKIKDHPVNDNYGNTFRVENGARCISGVTAATEITPGIAAG